MENRIEPRGLTVEECRTLCLCPRRLPSNATKFQIWKAMRDELLIRLLYETWARVGELLRVDVPDIDFDNCSILIRHPKGKAVFRLDEGRRVHVDTIHQQRRVFFGDYSRDQQIHDALLDLPRGSRIGLLRTDSMSNPILIRTVPGQ